MRHPGWGGDSDVFLAEISDTAGGLPTQWIFRFPRSPEVASSTATDVRLLRELAPTLPLPVPVMEFTATHENGAVLFVAYQAVPGNPLRPDMLTALPGSDRTAIARSLGQFLTALHRFPTEIAVECGLTLPRLSLIERAVRQNAAVRTDLYPLLDPEERAFLAEAFRSLLWELRDYDPAPRLCHGDLSSDHILVSVPRVWNATGDSPSNPPRWALSGIIDFGDVSLGDLSGDFVWKGEFGDDFFEQALTHYDNDIADPDQFRRVVKLRWWLLPTCAMAFGLETGQPQVFEEGRRQLRSRMESI